MRGRDERLSVWRHRLVGTLACVLAAQAGSAGRLPAQVYGGWGAVSGRVLDVESGRVLEGATLLMVPAAETPGSGDVLVTEGDGEFRFRLLASGPWRLTVTRLGYVAVVDTLDVPPGMELAIEVSMSRSPVELEPLVVEVARRPLGPLVGFERRRRIHRGTFFTRQDIELANAVEFTDLVRTVPGVRIVPVGRFRTRVVFRGGCAPDLWLDGTHVATTLDIDDFIEPHAVEAIEIYRGPDLPGEFGTNLCGAIVAWTRRGDPSTEDKSIGKQLLVAGGILLGFLLIHR